MLSYRHAFHAGNFADVLKHWVLIECLEYLKQKEKPFVYYDTHSGPGMYALESDFAQKNQEFKTGISQLWDQADLPKGLSQYCDCIRAQNPDGTLRHYPGSPCIAQALMREWDRLTLCELHRTEHEILSRQFAQDKRAEVWNEDGLNRTLKLLPPRERRGIVLIDPSYEMKEDYERVVEFLQAAHRKFAQGVYLLWYPVVERERIDRLEAALINSGIRNITLFELGIQADTAARGMTSSGMIVINPPWTLKQSIDDGLSYLGQKLEVDGFSTLRSEVLVEE